MKTFREQGLDFLSNFYYCEFEWEGVKWTSSEAAYQACKDGKQEWEKWSKLTPSESKRKGRSVLMVEEWEDVRLEKMESILRAKFSNKDLNDLLLGTFDQELIEWNYWGDTYWGRSIQSNKGENWLGCLLMQIRDEQIELK